MSNTYEKEDEPPKKLPSVSDIISSLNQDTSRTSFSVPSTSHLSGISQRTVSRAANWGERPPPPVDTHADIRHFQSGHFGRQSISNSIQVPTVAHTPQSSISGDLNSPSAALPSPQESASKDIAEYSYEKEFDDRSFQDFRFPLRSHADQTTDYSFPPRQDADRGRHRPKLPSLQAPVRAAAPGLTEIQSHHIKSSSTSTAMRLEGQDKFEEEELIENVEKLISLSSTINHSFASIHSGYLGLVNESRSKYSHNIDTVEGHPVDPQSLEKKIRREAFKEFIMSTPLYDLDSLLFDLQEDVKIVQTLKDYKQFLTYQQQIQDSAPGSSNWNASAQISPEKSQIPPSKSEQSKRQKHSQTSPKRHKAHPSLGGDIIHLNINKPVLETNAHMSPVSKNYLNKEFTIKKDISCDQCGSRETPEWRKGPASTKTLCNACGLFYAKLIKKYGMSEAERALQERKATGRALDRKIG